MSLEISTDKVYEFLGSDYQWFGNAWNCIDEDAAMSHRMFLKLNETGQLIEKGVIDKSNEPLTVWIVVKCGRVEKVCLKERTAKLYKRILRAEDVERWAVSVLDTTEDQPTCSSPKPEGR